MRYIIRVTVFILFLAFTHSLSGKELTEEERKYVDKVSAYDNNDISPSDFTKVWQRYFKIAVDRNYSDECKKQLCIIISSFYYTEGVIDSVGKYTSLVKKYALMTGDTDEYFNQSHLYAYSYIFTGDVERAFSLAKQMHREAAARRNSLGLALSAFIIGSGYMSLDNYKASIPYSLGALYKFIKYKKWDNIITAGGNYIIAMCETKRERETLSVLRLLDSMMYSNVADDVDMSPGCAACFWGSISPMVYSKLGDKKNVERCLRLVEVLYDNKGSYLPKVYLLDAKRYYARVCRKYGSELLYTDSLIEMYRDEADTENEISEMKDKAGVLVKLNRYEEAFKLMNIANGKNDSLKNSMSRIQLNDLSASYRISELKLANEKLLSQHKNNIILFFIVITVLLLAIGSIIVYFYFRQLKLHKSMEKQNKELIETNARVLAANAAKRQFFINMSHEIRTPLNSIVGFSEILGDEDNIDADDMDFFCAKIEENSITLMNLINDILAITDLDSGKIETEPKEYSVNEICNDVYVKESKFLNGDVDMRLSLPNKKVIVKGSSCEMKMILEQLIGNAIKFTDHGEIEITLDADRMKNKVYIKVRDTGIGISPDMSEKIFERFYKIDAFKQGNGLGLSLCRILCERQNGSIRLDTDYRKGALFIVELPLFSLA